MHATTVGVDLAKNVFEVAVADESYRVVRKRLTRTPFQHWIGQQRASVFVLEACGSAHHWGRRLRELGHEVRLLPAQYVRAYVKRNKTDRADAAALIEASRCADIAPVPIKSVEQQCMQQLHRLREQYKSTRSARINLLRGCLREYGLVIPRGVGRGIALMREALQIADNGVPDALRPWVCEVLEEIEQLKRQMQRIERQLEEQAREDELVQRWLEVPGVGLLGATALRAQVGDFQRFHSGRHFASYLGIPPREYSSGERRRLGRMSKRGDAYLRTLLIHGARSALVAAKRAEKAGRALDALRRWTLQTEQRIGKNKATVALANKLARILWSMAKYERPFDGSWSASHRPAPLGQAA
jgi:transposase